MSSKLHEALLASGKKQTYVKQLNHEQARYILESVQY